MYSYSLICSSRNLSPLASYINPRYFSIGRDNKGRIYNYSIFADSNLITNSSTVNDINKVDPTPQITVKRKDTSFKFVGRLLDILNNPNNNLINNQKSQRIIENIVFEEFESVIQGNNNKLVLAGVNTEILTPLSKYLTDKRVILDKYINNLYNEQNAILNNKNYRNKVDLVLKAKVITSLDKSFIRNLCFYYFLLIYTY